MPQIAPWQTSVTQKKRQTGTPSFQVSMREGLRQGLRHILRHVDGSGASGGSCGACGAAAICSSSAAAEARAAVGWNLGGKSSVNGAITKEHDGKSQWD